MATFLLTSNDDAARIKVELWSSQHPADADIAGRLVQSTTKASAVLAVTVVLRYLAGVTGRTFPSYLDQFRKPTPDAVERGFAAFFIDGDDGVIVDGPSAGLAFALRYAKTLISDFCSSVCPGVAIRWPDVGATGVVLFTGFLDPIRGLRPKALSFADAVESRDAPERWFVYPDPGQVPGQDALTEPDDVLDPEDKAFLAEKNVTLCPVATVGQAVDLLLTFALDHGLEPERQRLRTERVALPRWITAKRNGTVDRAATFADGSQPAIR